MNTYKPYEFNSKSIDFLKKYLNNHSPVSYEIEGQKLWLNYLRPFIDEEYVDYYGTAYGVINPGKDIKVMIEAHADEISWFVNYISDNGLIYVVRNGGSDALIAPSKKVVIHSKHGHIQGVFGWHAIHTRHDKEDDPMPKVDNIYVDIGLDSKDKVLEKGVRVGDVITFVDEYFEMEDYIVGRALDNRMGGFCIAEVARLISENKSQLPFSLYIVNSVQEEIGLRGAEMIAEHIKPHIAIVTDVTHHTDTPKINAKKAGSIFCNKGPSITLAPAIQRRLFNLIEDTAEKHQIPYQRAASSRSTGTDTDAIAYSGCGVISALISLPLKYMHTTVEMVHKNDVAHVIDLIYCSLIEINSLEQFKLMN